MNCDPIGPTVGLTVRTRFGIGNVVVVVADDVENVSVIVFEAESWTPATQCVHSAVTCPSLYRRPVKVATPAPSTGTLPTGMPPTEYETMPTPGWNPDAVSVNTDPAGALDGLTPRLIEGSGKIVVVGTTVVGVVVVAAVVEDTGLGGSVVETTGSAVVDVVGAGTVAAGGGRVVRLTFSTKAVLGTTHAEFATTELVAVGNPLSIDVEVDVEVTAANVVVTLGSRTVAETTVDATSD